MDSLPPSYILEPVTMRCSLPPSRRGCFRQSPLCSFHQAVTSLWYPQHIHPLALNSPPKSTICTSEPWSPAPLHRYPSSLLLWEVQQLPPPGTMSPGRAVPSKSSEGKQKALEIATPTKQVGRHKPMHAPSTKMGTHPVAVCIICSLGEQKSGPCSDPLA